MRRRSARIAGELDECGAVPGEAVRNAPVEVVSGMRTVLRVIRGSMQSRLTPNTPRSCASPWQWMKRSLGGTIAELPYQRAKGGYFVGLLKMLLRNSTAASRLWKAVRDVS